MCKEVVWIFLVMVFVLVVIVVVIMVKMGAMGSGIMEKGSEILGLLLCVQSCLENLLTRH